MKKILEIWKLLIGYIDIKKIFETWKPLVGYEGIYEISDHGRVRALDREVLLFGKIPRIIKAHNTATRGHVNGYRRFCVWKNNKKETIYVHRAVAMAFLPNKDPENFLVVNHKDLNKENNHVSNLAWINCSQNIQHYYDNKDF